MGSSEIDLVLLSASPHAILSCFTRHSAGPNQLALAANLIPLVYVVHFIFFPVAYPIAKLLDYVLGHDDGITVYNRSEIATMMNIQHEEVRYNYAETSILASTSHVRQWPVVDRRLHARPVQSFEWSPQYSTRHIIFPCISSPDVPTTHLLSSPLTTPHFTTHMHYRVTKARASQGVRYTVKK